MQQLPPLPLLLPILLSPLGLTLRCLPSTLAAPPPPLREKLCLAATRLLPHFSVVEMNGFLLQLLARAGLLLLLLLALLQLRLGAAGAQVASPSRTAFPGHCWITAVLNWAAALQAGRRPAPPPPQATAGAAASTLHLFPSYKGVVTHPPSPLLPWRAGMRILPLLLRPFLPLWAAHLGVALALLVLGSVRYRLPPRALLLPPTSPPPLPQLQPLMRHFWSMRRSSGLVVRRARQQRQRHLGGS